MAITSMNALKKYAKGVEIELPGFYGTDETITVLLKRPSLLALAEQGDIPNTLLATASKLFREGSNSSTSTADGFKDTATVMNTIAKASLIDPSYDDFTKAGLTITDQQLLYIYNFSQTGVDALRLFRAESKTPSADINVGTVSDETK